MVSRTYPQLNDDKYIKQRLLQDGLSVAELAREIGCPHRCLANEVRRILSTRQLSKVRVQRRTFTLEQKLAILNETRKATLVSVAAKHDIHPNLLQAWKTTHRDELGLSAKNYSSAG